MLKEENRNLLNKLDNLGLINQRDIFWRQITPFILRNSHVSYFTKPYSQVEFMSKLDQIQYKIKSKTDSLIKQNFLVWNNSFRKPISPIFSTQIKLNSLQIPVIVSIDPMPPERADIGTSQYRQNLEIQQKPIHNKYLANVKGVIVEKTDNFWFWTPLLNNKTNEKNQRVSNFSKINKSLINYNSASSENFYMSLILTEWNGGKRPQQKTISLDLGGRTSRLVPYYLFNPKQDEVIIYPADILRDTLYLPTVIRGDPIKGTPQVLGVGFYKGDKLYYWSLNKTQEKKAKKSLINHLGFLE